MVISKGADHDSPSRVMKTQVLPGETRELKNTAPHGVNQQRTCAERSAAYDSRIREDYIPKFLPRHRVVYHWFDVYDLEEQRL
jgi:hypothetical protein